MSQVTDFLTACGVEFEAIRHDPTISSIEEARALGIGADDVLKALLVTTAGDHRVLVVLPASRKVDIDRLREALQDHHAHLSTENELQGAFPNIELGALPPLGSLLDIPAYADNAVLDRGTVLFAAGRRDESIRMRPADLGRIGRFHWVALSSEEDPALVSG
jgi:Ala-tRNA(Pro) deacylase